MHPSIKIGFPAARWLTALLLAAAGAQLTGCATVPPEEAPLRQKFLPRWETNEVAWEDAPRHERIARNMRDGAVGIIDNAFQAVFSFFVIGPTTGLVVQKLAVMVGDVVGLIDDNAFTEHIFKGIVSRQFLKFGSSGREFLDTLGVIHETQFAGPRHSVLDYVGNKKFHTKVYGSPSAVTSMGGMLISDLLIRPAGNVVLMFGGRETQKKIDKFGLRVIEKSANAPFL